MPTQYEDTRTLFSRNCSDWREYRNWFAGCLEERKQEQGCARLLAAPLPSRHHRVQDQPRRRPLGRTGAPADRARDGQRAQRPLGRSVGGRRRRHGHEGEALRVLARDPLAHRVAHRAVRLGAGSRVATARHPLPFEAQPGRRVARLRGWARAA